MYNTVIFLTLLTIVCSHDVIIGTNTEGRKIYDEVRQASPAIWRQVENVTVETTDAEVISRVVITDLRPEKDGDAKIIDGGEGQNNVTLELKSPTVLRGYEFRIQVYSVPEDNIKSGDKKVSATTSTASPRVQRNPEEDRKPSLNNPRNIGEDNKKVDLQTGKLNPTPMPDDTHVNEGVTKKTDDAAEDINGSKLNSGTVFGNRPQTFNVPVVTSTNGEAGKVQIRHARDTLTPEIPEEIKIDQKSKNKKDGNDNSTPNPVLVSRESSHHRHTPVFKTTSKPETTEIKRDARDTEDKKSDDKTTLKSTVLENKPHVINVPAVLAARNGNEQNDTLDRRVRQTSNVKIQEENQDARKANENKDETKTQNPIITSRQGSFNRPRFPSVSTTEIPSEIKRNARNTEDDNKNDNVTPKTATPFVGNRPTIVPAHPVLTARSEEASNDTLIRKVREAVNPEIPEENQNAQKKNENEDKTKSARPLLTSRQGSLNRPVFQSGSTIKHPSTPSEVKRDARNTEDDKKRENASPITTTTFAGNKPLTVPAVIVARNEDASNDTLNRKVREAVNPETPEENQNKDETKDDKTTTLHPKVIGRQNSFQRPQSTVNKSEVTSDAQRNARDTENKKSDDNKTPKASIGDKPLAFNVPAVSRHAENTNNPHGRQTREAFNPEIPEEHQDAKKNNEGTKTDKDHSQVPLISSRTQALPETTNKPDLKDSKRDVRNTETDKTNDAQVPKIISASTPLDVTSTPAQVDKKTSDEDDSTTNGRFVPPPGYKRVVYASQVANEKERTTRDVENDKKLNPPTNVAENKSSETSTAFRGLVSTVKTLETNGTPTTEKSHNKRDTEIKEEIEKKKQEENWKNIPRVLGEQNDSERKPVISIQ